MKLFHNISQERYASAAGLSNFIRILIGSGFGTSLSIQLWTRLEIFHHARLTESLTAYQPYTREFYNSLNNYSSDFPTDVVNRVLDSAVEQQAFVLSSNDVFWLGGWIFLAMIPILFLTKRITITRPQSGAKLSVE